MRDDLEFGHFDFAFGQSTSQACSTFLRWKETKNIYIKYNAKKERLYYKMLQIRTTLLFILLLRSFFMPWYIKQWIF